MLTLPRLPDWLENFAPNLPAHLERAAEWTQNGAALEKKKAGAVAELAAAAATWPDVIAVRRELEAAELDQARGLVQLLRERLEITVQAAEPLKAAVAEREAEARATREKVAKQLAKIGFSPQSDPRFVQDRDGAARRFQSRLNDSEAVREATAKADAARRTRLEHLPEVRRETRELLEGAEDQLRGVYLRLLGQPAPPTVATPRSTVARLREVQPARAAAAPNS